MDNPSEWRVNHERAYVYVFLYYTECEWNMFSIEEDKIFDEFSPSIGKNTTSMGDVVYTINQDDVPTPYLTLTVLYDGDIPPVVDRISLSTQEIGIVALSYENENGVVYRLEQASTLLTLKVPRKNASKNVVCWSRLLQIIA